jgi:hypothetical protein
MAFGILQGNAGIVHNRQTRLFNGKGKALSYSAVREVVHG